VALFCVFALRGNPPLRACFRFENYPVKEIFKGTPLASLLLRPEEGRRRLTVAFVDAEDRAGFAAAVSWCKSKLQSCGVLDIFLLPSHDRFAGQVASTFPMSTFRKRSRAIIASTVAPSWRACSIEIPARLVSAGRGRFHRASVLDCHSSPKAGKIHRLAKEPGMLGL
jgi:hypothetical protein